MTTTVGAPGADVVHVPSAWQISPPRATVGGFLRAIFTDHSGDFDMGAVLVGVVICFMCGNAGYDTVMLHTHFDAQNFGIGVAAVLGGFAAYKWGDVQRAAGSSTSTTVATSTTSAAPIPPGP